jgi:hypothetical protein
LFLSGILMEVLSFTGTLISLAEQRWQLGDVARYAPSFTEPAPSTLCEANTGSLAMFAATHRLSIMHEWAVAT